jgi:hypothetical protein
MGQAPINDGINRRSSKVRKSPQPGPAVIRAGNYLAVVCLFFGVAFAAFVSGPLEQRVDLFWFGLIPAIGFYLGGNILGRLLVLGVKLCDMMMARCSRYAVRLTNDFLSWAGRQVSNWFTGAPERGSKLQVPMPTNFVRDSGWKLWFVIIIGLFLTSAIYGWLGTSASYWQPDSQREEPTTAAPFHAVVEQIIRVESGGDPNAKNKRSSATGLGQFLDETWLDMIRTHRPNLAKGAEPSGNTGTATGRQNRTRDYRPIYGAKRRDVEETRSASDTRSTILGSLCRCGGSCGGAVRDGECRRRPRYGHG